MSEKRKMSAQIAEQRHRRPLTLTWGRMEWRLANEIRDDVCGDASRCDLIACAHERESRGCYLR